MDDHARVIATHEYDRLVSTWDHRIEVSDAGEGNTTYRDEIVIDAGRLTAPVALYADLSFGHRQRRWLRALKKL